LRDILTELFSIISYLVESDQSAGDTENSRSAPVRAGLRRLKETEIYPGTSTTEDEEGVDEKNIREELSSAVRTFVESAVQDPPLRQGEFSLGPQLKGAKGFWQGNCLMVQDASGRVKNLGIMKRTGGSSQESSDDEKSESSQQWLNQARERLKKE